MTIPRIAPYDPPTLAELPAPVVDWRVDPERCVLLVHDMQRHFVGFYDQAAEPMVTTVERIASLREHCWAAGTPVVFSAQPGNQTARQRGLLTDFWGAGVPDATAAAVIDELSPTERDTVLTKWRYSAFHGTELAELMTGWGRDQLLICGIYAHIGIAATALDAFMRDIQPFIVVDAVADFSRADQLASLSTAARRFAVPTTTALACTALGNGAVRNGAVRNGAVRNGAGAPRVESR